MSEPSSAEIHYHDHRFYEMVGRCITEWARVEEELFQICWLSLGSTKERAAIVFYRTPTMETRLQLTSELLETALPRRERPIGGHDHKDVKLWKNLSQEISDLLPTRNRIAHDPVKAQQLSYGTRGLLSTPTINHSWFEFGQSEHKLLRPKQSKSEALLTDDLIIHEELVKELTEKLKKFLTLLQKHVEAASPQESPQ